MVAVFLLMINLFVSWQRDRERKEHDEHVGNLLTEIRDELKKANGRLTRRNPSQQRRP